MQLKKLELFGFKSFADKTEFVFEPGITAFVGPNGCGKSNIVDAVKWVLGEQSAKSLRGKEMQDVIFNGAGSRKPLGYAEVSLTINNGQGTLPLDFEEICITRRLHRSGESEYFINKQASRLRDIRETFFDTGVGKNAYSVIEQGKVDLLIQSNSKERRLVFEEASGITRFKAQKKQAESKLARVSQNMARVTDIIEEVQRQLRSVKYQAAKARKFKTYSDRLKLIRVAHGLRAFSELSSKSEHTSRQVETLESQNAILNQKSTANSNEQEQLARQIESLEDTIRCTSEKLSDVRDEYNAAQNVISTNTGRTEDIERHRATQAAQTVSINERIADIEKSLQNISQELENVGNEHSQISGVIGLRESAVKEISFTCSRIEAEIEASRTEHFNLSRRSSDLQASLSGLAANRTALDNSLIRRRKDLEERSARINAIQEAKLEEARALENLRGTLATVQEKLSAASAELAEVRNRIEAARARLAELTAEKRSRESRRQVLQDLESRSEGISSGVRIILNSAKTGSGPLDGVRGMVADLMKVDLKFAPAIEALLTDRAQSVVIEKAREAEAGIEFLRNSDNGRAEFLPLDRFSVNSLPRPLQSDGVRGRASELITFDPEFASLFDFLLGDALLVESFEKAKSIISDGGATRIATLQGDVLDAKGPMTGGKKKVGGVISRRSELAALNRDIAGLEAEIVAASVQLAELKDRRETLDNNIESLAAEKQSRIVAVTTQESKIQQLNQQTRSLAQDVELLEAEISAIKRETKENEDKTAMTVTEHDKVMGKLEQLAAATKEKQNVLDKKKLELTAESASLMDLNKELVRIDGNRSGLQVRERTLQEELRARRRELETLHNQGKQLADNILEAQNAITAAREQSKRLALNRSELQELLSGQESRKSELRRRAGFLKDRSEHLSREHSALDEKLQTARIAQSEARLKADNLSERIIDDYGVNLSAFHLSPEQWAERPLLKAEPAEVQDEDGQAPQSETTAATEPEPGDTAQDESLTSDELQPPRVPQVSIEEMTAYRDSVLELADNPEADWEAISAEIEALRGRISRLGPVNIGAIRQQDELETRSEFLTSQRDDLLQAQRHEEEIIRQLNKTSRERFIETFELVREHFKETFRRMFAGGRADMFLEPDVDPLEAGVEIIARPPGKEPRSISLLSGGEKALTAVSLLFAIFKAKPSPFCLLDEADAALDESNTSTVAAALQEFAQESQFIVITHNKLTMSIADVLYGITQEEKGISNIIAVKLEDVDNHLKETDISITAYGDSSVPKAG